MPSGSTLQWGTGQFAVHDASSCCCFSDRSQKTVADTGRDSSTVREANSQEWSSVDYMHNVSRIKPRRSLTAVHTNVMNQPQAEDLSTSKQQGLEFGVRTDKSWQSFGNSQRAGVGDKIVRNVSYRNAVNGRDGSCFIDEEVSQPVQSPYWNVESYRGNDNSHFSKTHHPRLESVNSGRPSSDSTGLFCDKNLHVVEDVESWLSTSVGRQVETGIVTQKSLTAPSSNTSGNWNTPSQLEKTTQSGERRGFYSEALPCGERSMSATSTPSTEVQGFNCLTDGGRNTSTASYGITRTITTFAAPVANSGPKFFPQNGSAKLKAFPARRSLDSLGGLSSSVFARTPVLPTEPRLHVLSSLWPTPARALGEPSPVATVMPQVQTAVGKLHQQPARDQSDFSPDHSDPVDAVGSAQSTLASAPLQTQKRKRKRRSVFGPRRCKKKSQQTPVSHIDVAAAGHDPVSNSSIAKPPAEVPVVIRRPNPAANAPTTRVDTATCSSVARSEVPVINGNQMSTTPLIDQSISHTSVGNKPAIMARVLKPIENQQYGCFVNSTYSDVCKPSVAQRSVPLGWWLETNTAGSGHKVHPMTYIKRQQSSADVQKVPSTSPQHDVFDFCGDDDDIEPSRDRSTPLSLHRTSTQHSSWPAVHKPPTAVAAARQKRETFDDCITHSKLR